MFDTYSSDLFESIPRFIEVDAEECRRWLSKAYLYCIDNAISIPNETDGQDAKGVFNNLRKLGDSLESAAVFDKDLNDSNKQAAAFIAAESLSLLARHYKSYVIEQGVEEILLVNEYIYTKVESALLYLISGFDANASSEVKEINEFLNENDMGKSDSPLSKVANQVLKLIVLLCDCRLNEMPKNLEKYIYVKKEEDFLLGVINENNFSMYELMAEAIHHYLKWLIGEFKEGLNNSIEIIQRLINISSSEEHAPYANIYHLSKLLEVTFNTTSERAVVHKVPLLPMWGDEVQEYLKVRAKGNQNLKSRPFLWPSTKEFVEQVLPGPQFHSIISMPTGSGKSFIAELAISQALQSGWVLYIAPTNALTHQIRRDLTIGLNSIPNIEIKSFVGEKEYTTLSTEIPDFNNISNQFVAVMTPEKCSLALRLNPEVFENCSLCIFDEFHLITESERGIIADLVLGQIITISKSIKLMLMSAMINNPEELANWLEEKTEFKAMVPTVKWKPTRTLRGAVGINMLENELAYFQATERLKDKKNRVNEAYSVSINALFCLTGIWQTDSESDYGLYEFDGPTTKLQVTRNKDSDNAQYYPYIPTHPGWTNNTSKEISVHLAMKNIPTITFFPYDKNHVFSVGNIDLSEKSIGLSQKIKDLIEVSEMELGIKSEVGRLIDERRISVHSSAMLEAEKEASEEAFKNNICKLMFATGTLAQGLNLPALAVVIAGEAVGDRRETGSLESKKRSKATILNAIGRAGRAGFSNQSLSLIVPDKPMYFKGESDYVDALSQLSVLQEPDAVIKIESPLENFLDVIINRSFKLDEATSTELFLISFFSNVSGEIKLSESYLNNTYAAYRKRYFLTQQVLNEADDFIEGLKENFIQENESPEWIIEASRKAGVDYFTTLNLYKVIARQQISLKNLVEDSSVLDILELFFECIREMPPKNLSTLFLKPPSTQKYSINEIHKFVYSNEWIDELNWEKPETWNFWWDEFFELTKKFMTGETINSMVTDLYQEENMDYSRSAGKPIPTILSIINGPIANLSQLSGVFVAIFEELLDEEGIVLPFSISALPLAIKNGCDDYSSLSWYRFGIRYRVLAHLLSRMFPLELEEYDDKEARKQITIYRKLWLKGDNNEYLLSKKESDVLNALRRIIT